MQQQPGLFIAIEGIDGAGKATQCELLREHLEAAGYQVLLVSFPRYDQPSSYFIRQYLSGAFGQHDQIGPYTASLFYALDRYEAASTIRQALAAGTIVIADRFVGSSMAHQGSKIAHPEERRGYFIWLDNLEFYLLGTPRPNLNLVLRVPPMTAAQHIEDRRDQVSQSRKLNNDEANVTTLQASANVYDDLCQLFPKDFTCIDCVRNEQLMSPAVVHTLIWGKVEPLLPVPIHTSQSVVSPSDNNAQAQSATASEPETHSNTTVALRDLLLAAKSGNVSMPGVEEILAAAAATNANPFDPPKHLDAKTRQAYTDTMQRLFANCAAITDQLSAYIQRQSPERTTEATFAASNVLPLAVNVAITGISPNDTNIEAPALSSFLEQFAQSLPRSDSGIKEHVRLVNAVPRNEMDMVAPILFEASDVPLTELTNTIATWSYEQKAAVLRTYAALADNAKLGLHNIRYNWDCFSDIATLYAVLRLLPGNAISWQRLTPRFGYEMPTIVEESGLSDLYEASFDASLELFSLLQQGGYMQEAERVILLGHRVRWNISCSLQDLVRLLSADDPAVPAWFVTGMREQLSQTHPLLSQRTNNPSNDAAAQAAIDDTPTVSAPETTKDLDGSLAS